MTISSRKKILVSLDTTQQPPVLRVDNGTDANMFDKDEIPHVIVWILSGHNLAQAKFMPMDQQPHGFDWISAIPNDTFGPAVVGPAGRMLWVLNYHNVDHRSGGTFTYILRVGVGGNVYETVQALIKGTTDPNIVNR